jgi:hypothetical protein
MKIQIDDCNECETEVLIKGDTSKNEVKELIEHILVIDEYEKYFHLL